jgi:hypothetical protein
LFSEEVERKGGREAALIADIVLAPVFRVMNPGSFSFQYILFIHYLRASIQTEACKKLVLNPIKA